MNKIVLILSFYLASCQCLDLPIYVTNPPQPNDDMLNPESDPEFIREPKLLVDRLVEAEQELQKRIDQVDSSTSSLDQIDTVLPDHTDTIPGDVDPEATTGTPVEFSGDTTSSPFAVPEDTIQTGGVLGEVEQLRELLNTLKTRVDVFVAGPGHVVHQPMESVPVKTETHVEGNQMDADMRHLIGVTSQHSQELAWLREELSRVKDSSSSGTESKDLSENDVKTIDWLKTTVRELRDEMTELYTAVNATQSLQRQIHLETRLDVLDSELTRLRHLLTGVIVHKEGEKSEISELYASVHRLEAMQTSVSERILELTKKYAAFEEAHGPEQASSDVQPVATEGTELETTDTTTHPAVHHHRRVHGHHFLMDLHKTVDTLNEKLQHVETRNDNLTNAFEESVRKLGSLNSAFTDIQENFADDLTALRTMMANLSANVTHVHSTISELSSGKASSLEELTPEHVADETKKHEKSKKKKEKKEKSKDHKEKHKKNKNKHSEEHEDEEKNKSEEED